MTGAAVNIQRGFVPGPFGQIHFRLARPPDTAESHPPLVLCPPTPYSTQFFVPFMQHMARDRPVLAIDTPGFGGTDRPDALLTIEDFARSAAAAIDATGWGDGSVDALGYHTGGLVACELALLRPVRRLVLPGFPYFVGEARDAAFRRSTVPDEIAEDGHHLAQNWETAMKPRAAGLSLERVQVHFADLMAAFPDAWRGFHAAFTYQSDLRLPGLAQPVLLISIDGALKQETAAAVPVFPDAQHVHLPQFRTGLFDLGAEVVADHARQFLDR